MASNNQYHLASLERPTKALAAALDGKAGKGFWSRFPALVDEALAALQPRLGPESLPLPPQAQAFAMLLLKVPMDEDLTGKLLESCLEFWLRVGPMGWIFAVSKLQETTPSAWRESGLDSLPQPYQMLLIHLHFASPPPGVSALGQWAMRRMQASTPLSSKDIFAFLELLAGVGQRIGLQARFILSQPEAGSDPRSLLVQALQEKNADYARLGQAAWALADPLPASILIRSLTAAPETALSPLLKAMELVPADDPDRLKLCSALLSRLNAFPESDLAPALSRAAELGQDGLRDLVSSLPKDTQRKFAPLLWFLSGGMETAETKLPEEASLRLFEHYSLCMPDIVASIAQSLSQEDARNNEARQASEYATKLLSKSGLDPDPWNSGLEPKPGPHPSAPGLLDRLSALRKGNSFLISSLKKGYDVERLNLSCAKLNGLTVNRKMFREADFSRTQMDDLAFENVTIRNTAFNDARLHQVRLRGCRLEDVTFCNVSARAVIFDNCVLKNVRFDHAHWEECLFRDCEWSRVQARGALFRSCLMERLDIKQSGFSLSVFQDCRLRYIQIRALDLRDILFHSCSVKGTTLSLCRLTRTGFENSFLGIRVECCLFNDTKFINVRMDDPSLLSMELAKAMQIVSGSVRSLEMPLSNEVPCGPAAATAVLDRLRKYLTLRVKEIELLENNRRRLSLCLQALGNPRREFFLLVPFLLETNLLALKLPHARGPRCSVSGYDPCPETLKAAVNHFGEAAVREALQVRMSPSIFQVEALYTIGSLGTVAQSRNSDLDWWICLSAGSGPEFMARLKDKLMAMSQFGRDVFGLESTFFPMDLAAIRANHFGYSDRESSGTAQALLLKEEFYRTALKAAGKHPAWWLSPPEAGPEEYQRVLSVLEWAPQGMSERIVDLGHMEPIPSAEFFGAALWQLVKAIKSPFKSVLKLGLLEQYASQGAKGQELLCERLKTNLRHAAANLLEKDPYGLLLKGVRQAYQATGDDDSAHLVDLAFLLKIEAHRLSEDAVDDPALFKRLLLMELYGRDRKTPKWAALPNPLSRGAGLRFENEVKLGQKINAFMLNTYVRVQNSLESGDQNALIKPEDLTKLGRLLFSTFYPRPNKIPRIPMIAAKPFSQLSFSIIRDKKREVGWKVYGLPSDMPPRRDNFLEVRRDKDLVKLLLFLTANRLYRSGSALEADSSISSVSGHDIKLFLNTVERLFPTKELFEVDPEETLQAERVVKAMLVLNFLSDRESRELLEVGIVYATNWGELFSIQPEIKTDILLDQPLAYVAQALEPRVDSRTQLGMFLPYRSRCPRPKGLSRN